ncbi:MAG: dehydrogenase (quinone) [Acidimicrobiales bacterium]|jgi:NADH-quinone oxidoreductase subunit H|nr:dehydrogenase (quinone) [Acidimicrobiales bacterium]
MDPLFGHGIDLTIVLIVIGKTLATFVVLLLGVLLLIWYERKLISDMQNRIGPNRAGPYGILQTLADGIKLFFKEDLLPEQADRRVFRLAPYLSAVPAFAAFAVIPLGGSVSIAGHRTFLQLADPPVGVLFLLAMSSIAVYGTMLAGWSSGSKYPLLGGVRASAQAISYEGAMSLAIAAAVLIAGTLSTHGIVADQAGKGYLRGLLPKWNLFTVGVVPVVIYVIAATAEINRPPFDLVEADSELVGGFHTEYSSVRFALFYLAEFMNTITVSAVAITLFFGGPNGPEILGLGGWSGFLWFLIKEILFLSVYVWIRATLPRFRYDQLMDLGWKRLIPVALYWLLLIAALRVGQDQGWNAALVIGIGIGAGALAWGLLGLAARTGAEQAAEDALGLGEVRA